MGLLVFGKLIGVSVVLFFVLVFFEFVILLVYMVDVVFLFVYFKFLGKRI